MAAGPSPLVLDADERRILGAPAVVWPTAQLGLSLANRWKPGALFVLVNVYIDESGTHGESGFMVMAGYVGRVGSWNRFDKKWAEYLRHHGVTYFHAKELNGRQNEYKGWSDIDVERFAQRGVFIADSHALFGFTMRLDRADWQTHYIGDRKPAKLALDR